LYLVTDHGGVPWQDDGLREGDLEIRAAMTEWFTDELTAAGHSWVLLTGTLEQRLALAVRTVDGLLRHRTSFTSPMSDRGFGATRETRS
jgi:nicotinamide riboside kinase